MCTSTPKKTETGTGATRRMPPWLGVEEDWVDEDEAAVGEGEGKGDQNQVPKKAILSF